MSMWYFARRSVGVALVGLVITAGSAAGAQEKAGERGTQSGDSSPQTTSQTEAQEPAGSVATGVKRSVPSKSGVGESELSDRLRASAQQTVPTGRLPRYFAAVVDQIQRYRIYEIQAAYRMRIEELERQLERLEVAQMKEIEQVLTAEQLQRVEEMRAQRRVAGSASTAADMSP